MKAAVITFAEYKQKLSLEFCSSNGRFRIGAEPQTGPALKSESRL